jgi:hypothetical protein
MTLNEVLKWGDNNQKSHNSFKKRMQKWVTEGSGRVRINAGLTTNQTGGR